MLDLLLIFYINKGILIKLHPRTNPLFYKNKWYWSSDLLRIQGTVDVLAPVAANGMFLAG